MLYRNENLLGEKSAEVAEHNMEDRANVRQHLENHLIDYLEFLRQMVAINSFTANAAGVNDVGDLIIKQFSSLGFEPEFENSTDERYGRHIFLRRPAESERKEGAPPAVALISHLDTVYPVEEEQRNDFAWHESNERIYGPGIVDIKGGTLMIYMVLDSLYNCFRDVFESTDWWVCFNASEEVLTNDFSKHCLEKLPMDTRACLVFEAGKMVGVDCRLVDARKGRASFKATVYGKSAHSGNNHHQGANAILQLAKIIQNIEALTDYENQLTFNVGVVKGGVVRNRVPSHAEALIEMRAFDPGVFNQGIADILALDGKSDVSSGEGYPCQVTMLLEDRTEPWPSSPGLLHVWQQCGQEIGLNILPERRGGLSDANFLWRHFPTLDGLGPSGGNAHCAQRNADRSLDQEYVDKSSLIPKAELNIAAISRLIGYDVL